LIYIHVTDSPKPRIAREHVGVALGLPATAGRRGSEYAAANQVTRQAFSKGVVRFLRQFQVAAGKVVAVMEGEFNEKTGG
jgi:hypothetical protein